MHRVFPVLMLALGFVVGTSVALAYANGVINLNGDVVVDGTVTIQDGTQGLDKVFTSDSAGVGSWQDIPGGPGLSPTTIRSTQDAIRIPSAGTVIISQQFDINNDAAVFTSGSFFFFVGTDFDTGELHLELFVDGTLASVALGQEDTGDVGTLPISWTGDLSPGPHTIEVKAGSRTLNINNVCAGEVNCFLDTLIIE